MFSKPIDLHFTRKWKLYFFTLRKKKLLTNLMILSEIDWPFYHVWMKVTFLNFIKNAADHIGNVWILLCAIYNELVNTFQITECSPPVDFFSGLMCIYYTWIYQLPSYFYFRFKGSDHQIISFSPYVNHVKNDASFNSITFDFVLFLSFPQNFNPSFPEKITGLIHIS